MNYQDGKFIVNNLHLSNNQLASYLGMSEAQVRNYLYKNRIKRTPEEVEKIRLRVAAAQRGENNPNWKDGISKDSYHYKKIQMERHPEKVEARQKLSYQKRIGNIIPGVCAKCKSNGKTEAHHPDYSQPLKVIWLCRECHRELHQLEREQRRQLIKPLQPYKQLDLFNNYNFFPL